MLDAIVPLEEVYHRIKQEEKRRIARKKKLNPAWFRKRMIKLASYTKALSHVLAIGRAIGDGFAWFFYEPHRDLIDEHLKQQRQPLLPPKIGALGERLTLKNMLGIDGKLLLYHGITTFLRIGDFTLIDIDKMQISAIGEIKTGQPDADHIQTQISLISLDPARLPRIPLNPHKKKSEPMELPAAMLDRHKRQIKMMHEALATAAAEKEQPVLARLNQFHFQDLEDVARRCRSRKFEWVKAGDGLVIGAARLSTRRNAKLSDAVLSKGNRRVEYLIADAPQWAMKIVSDKRHLNALIIGSLFGHDGDLIAPHYSFPVSLWPIAPAVLADLLLQRVMVITLFNPAHLWAALEAKGFELVPDAKGRMTSARLNKGGRQTELTSLDYYTRLISYFMMTEASVIALIEQLIDISHERFDGRSMKVELRSRVNRFPSVGRRRKDRA